MAIKKMSSQEYNKILEESTNKIEAISQDMKAIKNDMYKKVNIINYEQEYLNHLNDKATYATEQEDTFIFLNNSKNNGLYNRYSNVVHAYFKQNPINVFNLKVVNGKESYFRDEVKVSINDIQDDYFKNILKAEDAKDKEIFFEEYEVKPAIKTLEDGTPMEFIDSTVKIVVEVDKNKAIGTSKFNMIEIDPYLYKSFDIKTLNVYTDESDIPTVTMNNINNIGKTRIMLDKKYDFQKVEFILKLKFISHMNGKDIMPFGIKHLFFLEADFRSDSYIIASYSSENYIDEVKDSVEVITSTGTRKSSLSEEGIRIFLASNNGMLENEQEPSNEIKKPIARNLKNIYFFIPLRNECIIGYKFQINKR